MPKCGCSWCHNKKTTLQNLTQAALLVLYGELKVLAAARAHHWGKEIETQTLKTVQAMQRLLRKGPLIAYCGNARAQSMTRGDELSLAQFKNECEHNAEHKPSPPYKGPPENLDSTS